MSQKISNKCCSFEPYSSNNSKKYITVSTKNKQTKTHPHTNKYIYIYLSLYILPTPIFWMIMFINQAFWISFLHFFFNYDLWKFWTGCKFHQDIYIILSMKKKNPKWWNEKLWAHFKSLLLACLQTLYLCVYCVNKTVIRWHVTDMSMYFFFIHNHVLSFSICLSWFHIVYSLKTNFLQ